MKTKLSLFLGSLLSFISLGISGSLTAQISINTDGSAPPSSAMLEVKSTTKGLLIPRMTTSQIMMISNPADGLQVYNTEWGKLYVYVAAAGLWKEMSYGTGTILPANPSFTCGDLLNDLRDGGKVYETVLIGTQCWMKQNLNAGTRIDGSSEQTNNSIIEKYCYNNDDANCDVYGGLYQWNEAMNYALSSNTNPSGVEGICPVGWHLPSDAEWCQLETFLDATVNCSTTGWQGTDVGGKMKSTGTLQAGTGLWGEPNTGATNSSGFTAHPGGYRLYPPAYSNLTSSTIFQTASESSGSDAWFRYLDRDMSQIYRYYNLKSMGFSVRCVKN